MGDSLRKLAEQWHREKDFEYWSDEEVADFASHLQPEAHTEAVRELLAFLSHSEGCGGFGADSLSNAPWSRTADKWRDCTCGLAKLLQAESAKSEGNE